MTRFGHKLNYVINTFVKHTPELQLNKPNPSDTKAPFLDLHLIISDGFIYSKIYDKRDAIANFPFF